MSKKVEVTIVFEYDLDEILAGSSIDKLEEALDEVVSEDLRDLMRTSNLKYWAKIEEK